MSTYTFAVQSTGRPYGSEAIPESAWSELSRHTTRIAAEKRLFCEIGDMRQRCNPRGGSIAAWDNHYRVVPLTPRTITWQLTCEGANGKPCPDSATAMITATWPPHTAQPQPAGHLPADWASDNCCRACYGREFGQYDPSFR